uniref:Uncharacterized protein n=1 Tax=Steinernema glaseri TaxID=37863 RepID=A0A1I7YLM3_9BILA
MRLFLENDNFVDRTTDASSVRLSIQRPVLQSSTALPVSVPGRVLGEAIHESRPSFVPGATPSVSNLSWWSFPLSGGVCRLIKALGKAEESSISISDSGDRCQDLSELISPGTRLRTMVAELLACAHHKLDTIRATNFSKTVSSDLLTKDNLLILGGSSSIRGGRHALCSRSCTLPTSNTVPTMLRTVLRMENLFVP